MRLGPHRTRSGAAKAAAKVSARWTKAAATPPTSATASRDISEGDGIASDLPAMDGTERRVAAIVSLIRFDLTHPTHPTHRTTRPTRPVPLTMLAPMRWNQC